VYETFYGLTESPFSTQPDPRFAYPSTEHKVAIAKMRYAADQKRGLAVLTGPVGSGKTTTAHQLLATWDADSTKKVAFLPSASDRTPAAFLRQVLQGFGVEPTRTEVDNKRFLQAFLVDQYKEGRHPILLLDEGQNVSSRNIDTIADLTNFQTAKTKLITVVMLAQDNLPNKLDRKDAFRSRIAVSGNLDPLTFEDTCAMIAHRLQTAGGGSLDMYFDHHALIEVYNTTKGIPRDICILCDAVLVNGYVHEQRQVTCALVERTVGDMAKVKKWPVPIKDDSRIARPTTMSTADSSTAKASDVRKPKGAAK
jgi:general secretion pathway protein A